MSLSSRRPDFIELDPQQVTAAAFLLRLSARPVIVAGAGAVAAGAGEELVRVAELVGSPVMTTAKGASVFPADHPLAAGVVFHQPEAAALLKESDMVMAVGTSFDSVPEGRALDLPAQMIHIDIDPAQINRVYPVRNGIVGDAKVALQRIIAEIEGAAPIQALVDARAADAPVRAARARASAPAPDSEPGPASEPAASPEPAPSSPEPA